MKKVILFFVFIVYMVLKGQAQCPVSINDDSGDGSTYIFTLSTNTQGANYPKLGTVTVQGQTYDIQGAYSTSGTHWAQVIVHATPVVRANEGTMTVVIGANTCIYGVLPVELVSFTAQAQVGSNRLTWTTASEVNNKGFQVERIMDNGQWTILGFVNAIGKAASYDFIDNTPLSTSYYRLRQIDNDGKETLSKVISVERRDAINRVSIKAYPNPVANVLTIETDKAGDFQILNLLGQQVLTGKTPSGGRGLDVSTLPQGTYFLKIGEEKVKFVKQ